MNPLQLFYNDIPKREAVKSFMQNMLRELAADKALKGEDTSGIKEAGECVEKSFDRLKELYGKIDEEIIPNSK